MTTPARISAFSWAIVPASVAGAESPIWAIGPIGTGRFRTARFVKQVNAVEGETAAD